MAQPERVWAGRERPHYSMDVPPNLSFHTKAQSPHKAQQGLVGLIAWRRIESPFSVSLFGAQRPPWTPYTDPRLDALAELYEFLLGFCPERIEAVGVE